MSVLAENLARWSYDVPFVFRGPVQSPEACLIYLDEGAARALGQTGGVWNRELHTQLVRRLTQDGARAVFFDIVFSDPAPDPTVDRDFAAALVENGHVFIGAALEIDDGVDVFQERTVAPLPLLRRSAAGWGLVAFRPVDVDYCVRRIYAGSDDVPSATWRAAVQLGAHLTDTPESRAELRWTNYYGPPGFFPSVSYDRALAAEGVPPGFFRDRIVFVGGRSTLDTLRLGKDDFRTPFSLLGADFSKGVEVHLTALLNLLGGTWLTRLDSRIEVWFAVGAGILLSGLLPLFRPHLAALLAALAIAGIGAFAYWLFRERQIWFAWSVPALVEAPLALAWALGTRYFVEERRRNALRFAFGHYLAPQMVDQIANADFDLKPGGIVVEASVLIVDLEGFTSIAEQLDDPERVSRILTEYFTHTTDHVLGNDGTIVHFAGDAMLAVWGAPLPQKDHAMKAAQAAWQIQEGLHLESDGRPLRARIGLHTGRVLAGNLGSAERFDYSVVGDTVNIASRLEGLNKHLGTNILLSAATFSQIGDRFLTRCLGEFRMIGKKQGSVIYELLGLSNERLGLPWMESFQRGLDAFRRGDLDAAGQDMQETITSRDGGDGPAEFYLQEIQRHLHKANIPDWTGVIELTTK